jgi:diadenosine tetraphosphate (Ap4A) HIT family hydrolase
MSEPKGAKPCPFCATLAVPDREIIERELVVAFRDAFPSAEGHTLVIPRRHVGQVTQLTADESAALWALSTELLATIEQSCDSVSIGINDGPQAGQTVGHVHLHLIPRHIGDVEDPRGGIRWVLPDTADYWNHR